MTTKFRAGDIVKDHPGSVRASWATEELRKLRVKAKP